MLFRNVRVPRRFGHFLLAAVISAGCMSSYGNSTDLSGSDLGDNESTDPPPPPPWTGSEDGGSSDESDAGSGDVDAGGGQDSGDAGTAPPPPHDRFRSAKVCATCHTTIYKQWSTSMHARALTSPLTLAETNQVIRNPLARATSPDPKRFCVNCHSPTAAAVTTSASLPLDPASHADEGISCTGCHQFNGKPTSGGGGISTSYQANLVDGTTYFGPLSDPVPNSSHTAQAGIAFTQRNLTCANCHNVSLDLDHDGRIIKGEDLVLQQTFDEYSDYRRAGGQETCVTCHMPVISGLTRVADGTSLQTPDRVVRNHSFVGVDYALDDPNQDAAQAADREALLQSSARFQIDRDSISDNNGLSFTVSIENARSGHNLPTGFAFTRQMWIEVRVVAASSGRLLFSSGLLTNPTDDLCDANILDEKDNPMREFIQGCNRSDENLVNIQAKLVDRVAVKRDGNGNIVFDQDGQPVLVQADNGQETTLQFLRGGPVARTRPVDGQGLGSLQPFEIRNFRYSARIDTSQPVTISARLMFRHMPPYFVRALAAGQPANELPQLAPLVANLRATEMASDSVDR